MHGGRSGTEWRDCGTGTQGNVGRDVFGNLNGKIFQPGTQAISTKCAKDSTTIKLPRFDLLFHAKEIDGLITQ